MSWLKNHIEIQNEKYIDCQIFISGLEIASDEYIREKKRIDRLNEWFKLNFV